MVHCATGSSLGGSSWTGGINWRLPPSRLCKNTMLQVYTLRITSVSCKSGCPDSGNHHSLPCEESSQTSILQGREVSSPAGRYVLYMHNIYVIYEYCNCFFLAGRQPLHGTGFERQYCMVQGCGRIGCMVACMPLLGMYVIIILIMLLLILFLCCSRSITLTWVYLLG